MTDQEMLKEFYSRLEEIYRLSCINGLLGWDHQVCLPPNGAMGRAAQQETLSKIVHQRRTDPKLLHITDNLAAKANELSDDDRVNVLETKRELDRARKLPESFVAEQTRTASLSYDCWTKARPNNDFGAVQPWLEKIVELCKKEADLVGYTEHAYDALLDVYEPRLKLSTIKPLLVGLGESLSKIIPQIRAKLGDIPRPVAECPEDAQYRLSYRVASDFGYDFASGRLDKAHHPFEASLGPKDVRITTRYFRDNYLSSLFSTMHETGHALYEQGLPDKFKGTPLGCSISLGVHESQSRFWENIIGRSPEFARYLLRILPEYLPAEVVGLSEQDLWKQINWVEPSLIRVEADEVTYSLHVVIRMLLEEQLISGSLKISELPEAWNHMYKKYLEITVPDNKNGVLQDVHWYSGSLGYFPTYALGNLFGAIMTSQMRKSMSDFDQKIQSGDFKSILAWLRTNVHEQGMRYSSVELIKRISGQELSEKPFIDYIKTKFAI